jgi:hypothetical protein
MTVRARRDRASITASRTRGANTARPFSEKTIGALLLPLPLPLSLHLFLLLLLLLLLLLPLVLLLVLVLLLPPPFLPGGRLPSSLCLQFWLL